MHDDDLPTLPPAPWWAPQPGDADRDPDANDAREAAAPGPEGAPERPPGAPRHTSNKVIALVAAVALGGGLLVGRAGSSFVGRTTAYRPTTVPWNGALGSSATTPPNNGASTGSGSASGTGDANSAARRVVPAVVNINTVTSAGSAAGTGMIITSSGEVLTNNHVIRGATQISVETSDGSRRSASVLGYDVTDDVALLKLDGVSGLPTISVSTATVSVGSPVVALGNALGKGGAPTVVTGSVTAVKQTITASDEGGANTATLSNLIQTDAPIQPGDSGGPLADTNGNVIGMDTAAAVGNGFARFDLNTSAEGYAIPIQAALAIAKQIERGQASGKVHIGPRGILGVQLQASGSGFGSGGGSVNGTVVGGLQPGGPADRAGIVAGDTITALDGTTVTSGDDLANRLGPFGPGDKVSVTWVDGDGGPHSATVALVEGPPA